jgi:hypothetical protein
VLPAGLLVVTVALLFYARLRLSNCSPGPSFATARLADCVPAPLFPASRGFSDGLPAALMAGAVGAVVVIVPSTPGRRARSSA